MTDKLYPRYPRNGKFERWLEARIGPRGGYRDDDGPQFRIPNTPDAEMEARGYVKVAVPGGYEWQKPHEITPTDFDAETDAPTSSGNGSKPKRRRLPPVDPDAIEITPRYRCPLCHRAECSH